MFLAVLLVSLVQSIATPIDWVPITESQIEASKVVRVDAKRLSVDRCQEATFESNGSDIVTESSFTTIVAIVVDRSGKVQRFRMVRTGRSTVAVTDPIHRALVGWRFRVASPPLVGQAFKTVIAFPKPLGSAKTTACQNK